MTLIDSVPADAVDRYADVLADVAAALAVQDIPAARDYLAPIAGERWAARVSSARTKVAGEKRLTVRGVSERSRAEALIRDGFVCSHCRGRGVPRCVLVGISDVFPIEFSYDRHYGHGRVHPAYWILALEADHTLAFAQGGLDDISNLTAMHALCNTQKSDAHLDELPAVTRLAERDRWDGLLLAYPGIVRSGDLQGTRHSSPSYHGTWLRRFGILPQSA